MSFALPVTISVALPPCLWPFLPALRGLAAPGMSLHHSLGLSSSLGAAKGCSIPPTPGAWLGARADGWH